MEKNNVELVYGIVFTKKKVLLKGKYKTLKLITSADEVIQLPTLIGFNMLSWKYGRTFH